MYRGLVQVLKSPSNPQNCRTEEKILEKGTLFSAPNSGMLQALVQKISNEMLIRMKSEKKKSSKQSVLNGGAICQAEIPSVHVYLNNVQQMVSRECFREVSPDMVWTRFTPQRAPKQCPVNGVWRIPLGTKTLLMNSQTI